MTPDNTQDLHAALRQFSEAKVPFIVGMEQLGIKDEELISDFIILNESAIKMDRCLLGVGGNECDFETDFTTFVQLSTEFEGDMIAALARIE